MDLDRDPGGAPRGGAAGGGSAGDRERRQGAALRRAGILPAEGDRPLGRGAPLLRPGARLPLRVQPGGGAPRLRRGGAHRARLRDGPLGRGDGLRAAHQLPAGDAGSGRDGVEGSRPRARPRGERHPGRARADRGGRRALRREAAREPGPARQRLCRCDARGVEGPPEGSRRRGLLRRGADGPAAVGPVDPRRPAPAGHGGGARHPRRRARARAEASVRESSLHPRGRGLAAPGARARLGGSPRQAAAGARAQRAHAVAHVHPHRGLAEGDRVEPEGRGGRRPLSRRRSASRPASCPCTWRTTGTCSPTRR